MKQVFSLIRFIQPYWRKSLLTLTMLIGVVVMDLSIPRLVERIIDQGINAHNLTIIIQTFFLMLGVSLLDTLFAVGNNLYSIQVGEGVMRDLRRAVFLKIQSFSFGDLDRMNTGQLMVRLTSDTSVFQRLVHSTLRVGTRAPLTMIGSVILMFYTDQRLALTISPFLALTLVIIILFTSKMGGMFLDVLQKLDRLNTILQENIAGVRLIKAFVRAPYEASKFAQANEGYTDRNVYVMRFISIMGPALSMCISAAIVLVIWAGGLQSGRGTLTVGALVAFVNYLLAVVSPLTSMVNLTNIWAAAIASAQRINEILDREPEVHDASTAASLPPVRKPEVIFENVGFRYQGEGAGMVLEDINLTARSGETIAILGATGSGKTTLVNLIPRFYDTTTGKVLVEGMDVRYIQQDKLLARIRVVPQENLLFSGSVRFNILYGNPTATDEEVVAASRSAQAHEFIMNLPNGYETRVEERGVNLSGGQKQRIAIARALLTRPAILILDDSTSSVDVETETHIQAAIQEWMHLGSGQKTHAGICFVVAQRISTVLKADRIIVLEKGRIAAEGTHHELIRTSPLYQEIYASQLGKGSNGA